MSRDGYLRFRQLKGRLTGFVSELASSIGTGTGSLASGVSMVSMASGHVTYLRYEITGYWALTGSGSEAGVLSGAVSDGSSSFCI